VLYYYYDSTALDSAYAISDDNFANAVRDAFEKRTWLVHMVYTGQPVKHKVKHFDIDQALKGLKYLFPTFNRENNEFLISAMENTGVRITSRGFQKDKSGEKAPDTPSDPLELRTDSTDAWDNLFIGMNFHNEITSPLPASSIR